MFKPLHIHKHISSLLHMWGTIIDRLGLLDMGQKRGWQFFTVGLQDNWCDYLNLVEARTKQANIVLPGMDSGYKAGTRAHIFIVLSCFASTDGLFSSPSCPSSSGTTLDSWAHWAWLWL